MSSSVSVPTGSGLVVADILTSGSSLDSIPVSVPEATVGVPSPVELHPTSIDDFLELRASVAEGRPQRTVSKGGRVKSTHYA